MCTALPGRERLFSAAFAIMLDGGGGGVGVGLAVLRCHQVVFLFVLVGVSPFHVSLFRTVPKNLECFCFARHFPLAMAVPLGDSLSSPPSLNIQYNEEKQQKHRMGKLSPRKVGGSN